MAFRTEVRLRARSICRASVARFNWRRVRTSRGTTHIIRARESPFDWVGLSVVGQITAEKLGGRAQEVSKTTEFTTEQRSQRGTNGEEDVVRLGRVGRDAGRGRRPSGEGRDGHKWPTPPPTCARRAPRHSTALRAVTPAGLRLLRFVSFSPFLRCELRSLRPLRTWRAAKLVTQYRSITLFLL